MKKSLRLTVVAAAGVLIASVAFVSCRSLDKQDLLQRLAALEKNQALGPLGSGTLSVDLGSGAEIRPFRYYRSGPQTTLRQPVVLVHGTPSTLYSWSEILAGGSGTSADGAPVAFEGLAADRDVVAIEVTGHGVAAPDPGPASFDRCARFIVAALEALELSNVHLVGSSYGGEFVWRAALLAPDRIGSVSLIDSSGFPRRDEDWLPEEIAMREMSLARYGYLLNSRSRIETALAPHFNGIPPDRVEEFYLVCANASNWQAMVDLARDENGLAAPQLAQLRQPALVLWGAADAAYPVEVYGQRFADTIPDARLRILPDTGHYPHEQRPRATLEVLREFFAEVESAGS